jgi:head-tail adaptor
VPYSTFLNGRAPTQLRGIAWLTLTDTAVLQTRSGVSDSGGGITSSWTAAGTINCRIDALPSAPRVTGGAIDERSTHIVRCPPDTAVTTNDRVAITGRGTYEVTAVRDRTAQWLATFEVMGV